MRSVFVSAIACGALIFIMPGVARSQASFTGIGSLPGGDQSQAYGLSRDGLVIVGQATFHDEFGGFIRSEAFGWSEVAGMIGLGFLDNVVSGSVAYASADAGQAIVGSGYADGYYCQAFRWTPGGGQVGLGALDNSLGNSRCSIAKGVSRDGSVVVGQSNTSAGQRAFRWTAATGLQNLGELPGGVEESYGLAVSADGSIVVGGSSSSAGSEAFLWTADSGMVGLGDLPGGAFRSEARAISAGGTFIVGYASPASGREAFLWSQEHGMIGLGDLPGNDFRSFANGVSADGKIVVGDGTTDEGSEAFIWTEEKGMRNLQSVLKDDYGIDLVGWRLSNAVGISDDGSVIAGTMYSTTGGKLEAFRIILPTLKIISPVADQLWMPGTIDTIRWSAPGVELVNIYLSADDGATYELIDFQVEADSGKYALFVPDSLSPLCRIKLEEVNDNSNYVESERFRIKGIELTRIKADGKYERFLPIKHGWKFCNCFEHLWPQSWWQQFDYANGNDPFTGNSYPEEWLGPNIYASPPVFPAWPTFVRAFDESQSYLGPSVYSPTAIAWWISMHKPVWGGSCSGFAVSALQAFDEPATFAEVYPGIPAYNELSDLNIDGEIRKVLNLLWAKWPGAQFTAHYEEYKNRTPKETILEMAEMFLKEDRDDRPLFIRNSKSGAHAVVPYRIEKKEDQEGFVSVFVYDPNYPWDPARIIEVDTVANTWEYTKSPEYNGTDGFFLMSSARRYYEIPLMQNNTEALAGLTPTLARKTETPPGFWLMAGSTAEIVITGPGGAQIGYADSLSFNDMPDGFALFPPTGYFSPPAGYFLPDDSYTISQALVTDSPGAMAIFDQNLTYSYSRPQGVSGEQDGFIYRDGLTICNPGNASRNFTLSAIVQTSGSERVFDIRDCGLAQNDSLRATVVEQAGLKFVNTGGAKQYSLELLEVAPQRSVRASFGRQAIPENTSHLISPDWQDLTATPLVIIVDNGNDGTADDTLSVEPVITQIQDDAGAPTLPAEFGLAQNYPNPFNPSTVISYQLPVNSEVRLAMYDLAGRLVRTLVAGQKSAGRHQVVWDATNDNGVRVASGVYLYRLQAGDFVQTRKLVLVR